MAIDPSQPEQVGSALLAYLKVRLALPGACYAEPPVAIGRGFDTRIYGFRLQGEGLDARWSGPLVLRLYTTPDQAEKAQRDAAVQQFAVGAGYPAVEPLAVEPAADPLGLPLMVMDRVAGVPMLERIGVNPVRIARLFAAMAGLHAQLHQLPVDGCPLPSGSPLIERRLEEFRLRLEDVDSGELRDALRWLEEHKAVATGEALSLCHNDFHPLNIMVGDDDALVVLDWTDAALGDRHHDVARTVALFRFAWIAAESRAERIALRLARGFLASRYLGPYNRLLPIDAERLEYWKAVQAYAAWLQMTELAQGSPGVEAAREDVVQRLPADLGPLVRAYFFELTRR